MRKLLTYSLGILLIVLGSCDELVDYYIGMNQQPDFTREADTDEFNIFAILRPDSLQGYNKSFVFVQRIWPALQFESFSILPGAGIVVEQIRDNDSSIFTEFPLRPPDSLFYDSLYRPIVPFNPQPGEQFRIRCEHPDLNPAVGELVFPSKPAIVNNEIRIENPTIRFSLEADTLIEMYDIYLSYQGSSHLVWRGVQEEGEDTYVEIVQEVIPPGAKLKIYSYESRLASYVGNSNISLNFNKYREGFTTLESGYGVFGALNFVEVEI